MNKGSVKAVGIVAFVLMCCALELFFLLLTPPAFYFGYLD